jgi:hypothetical protein
MTEFTGHPIIERLPEGGYVLPDCWKVGPEQALEPIIALCHHFERDGSSDCMNVATLRGRRRDWEPDASCEYACNEHEDWLHERIGCGCLTRNASRV